MRDAPDPAQTGPDRTGPDTRSLAARVCFFYGEQPPEDQVGHNPAVRSEFASLALRLD